MFSHVCVGVADVARAVAFYDGVLAPLGVTRFVTEADVAGWRMEAGGAAFYVGRPFDGGPPTPGNGTMAAFMAPSPEAVDAAHAAALAAGGACEGPPGARPQYGEGYYGAYFRDLDGNKVHVVRR